MHTCASSNFLFPRTYVYHIILTNFVNWTKTDSVNCEKSFIIKSFKFNALFNKKKWKKKWKLKNPYLPLVAISSTLLKVLKWSHNFTIHKRLCDHDNNRRVCTIYFSVITEKIPTTTTTSNSLHPKGIEPESNWRSISKMCL